MGYDSEDNGVPAAAPEAQPARPRRAAAADARALIQTMVELEGGPQPRGLTDVPPTAEGLHWNRMALASAGRKAAATQVLDHGVRDSPSINGAKAAFVGEFASAKSGDLCTCRAGSLRLGWEVSVHVGG